MAVVEEEVLDPEVEKAEIAATHAVIAGYYRHESPDIVLVGPPGTDAEVAMIRPRLREWGGDVALLLAAYVAANAESKAKGRGSASLAYAFGTTAHTKRHVENAKAAQQKQIRILAARKREEALRREREAREGTSQNGPNRAAPAVPTSAFQTPEAAAGTPPLPGLSSGPPRGRHAQHDELIERVLPAAAQATLERIFGRDFARASVKAA